MTPLLADRVAEALTDDNVQSIVDIASQGGITYWADEPTPAEFAGLPSDKEYTIVDGAEGFEADREVHYLSKDDIRGAYARLLDLNQELVNREYHGYIVQSWLERDREGIDAAHIDAGTADVIVQVAIFGEVRFG
ncbi:hypothetical protein ASD97_09990 [Streptomyces sp. Root63]|uniref:hypothetical protein n=1 Tax=unclassified Streptomyces TaxID=2593676 RepID=UPI0006FD6ED0|nr:MULTISPECIES: hypothetical protein [unclassified Streptomyces]KQX37008.1 hypothetical protein ASD29_07240 [Streptomyces sp. Root1295]KRA43931.1 hypothetical protein ASD97_09990 [Streptomyces sp. Root63]